MGNGAGAKRPASEPRFSNCCERGSAERTAQYVAPSVSEAPIPVQRLSRVSVFRTQRHTDERLTELPPLRLGDDGSGGAQDSSIFVCPETQDSKPWLGFGGSFTEAAAVTIGKMSPAKQDEVIRACFDRQTGLAYNLGRVHMGSCDFSLGNWTCGDLKEGDMSLKGFSIEHYEESILPLLRRSRQAAGGAPLTLMVSPWSPPPWMKTKKQFHGDGHLRPECYDAWALHFVKFVQAMIAAGVPIWAVSVQNEPEAAQVWESCIYTAAEERDFVKNHLGPAMHKAGLGDVKIIIWDHNRDGMLERAAVAYADPQAAQYIWGVGYHWYGDARFETWPEYAEVAFRSRQREDAAHVVELRARVGFENVRKVAELRPDKHIIFTEGCQELGGRPLHKLLGDWKLGERYAMNIIADINSGCEGWIDWNLCLDETGGPNHVRNLCSAPIICDTRSDQLKYQSSYYYMGHFSRYIRPGARRVVCGVSRDVLETTAWVNEDGSLVIVVLNQSGVIVDFWLKISCYGAVCTSAPSHSITTFVVDGGDC